MADCRILVPESRELDLFCRLLETAGAQTIRCPLVSILDLEDETPVRHWLDRLIEGRFDDLVLLTGEGLRRLLGVAGRAGRRDAAIAAIGRLRTLVRGPKPVRALREIGLAPSLVAAAPTTDGIIATLAGERLDGRRIGVQLYPDPQDDRLCDFLHRQGAVTDAITPYRYASRSDDAAVVAAIDSLAAGEIDLIAFTSSPQVRRLAEVARHHGLEDRLRAGLARTRIAAVGPVAAAAVVAIGGTVAIEPATSFHLKPLVAAITALLDGPPGTPAGQGGTV